MAEEMKTPAGPVPAADEQVEMICLPAHPPKKKSKEDVANAKRIANRYLGIAALEKIVNNKKAKQKQRQAARFKMPETPEEFYERAQKYLTGANCAVSFQERSAYYQKAADMFAGAEDFQDASQLAEQYAALAQSTLEEGYASAYAEALKLKQHASSEDGWFKAARAFQRIAEYRDAEQLAEECQTKLRKLHSAKKPILLLALALIVVLVLGGIRASHTRTFQYYAAKTLSTLGIDSPACTLLEGLGDYADSEELLQQIHYRQGTEKMERQDYSGAASSFAACEDYADSLSLEKECRFYVGQAALEAGNLDSAIKQLGKAGDYPGASELLIAAELEAIRSAEPGDNVMFGTDKFILLDRTADSALLLSSKLYGDCTYHSVREPVSWAECDMRGALNGIYMDSRFSEQEKAAILTTATSDATEDQIFLLSQEEYERYLPVMGSKDAIWWLRDNGESPDTAKFISNDGTVMDAGYPVDNNAIQGRAAFWVDITE